MLQVSHLFIYPIKSLGGIAVSNTVFTDRGFQYDRRYMLVDENNRFLTQREHPVMALLQTVIVGNDLVVHHKKSVHLKLRLPLIPVNGSNVTSVQVWDDICEAIYISLLADQWFSERIGISCRLVYMPESSKRNVDARFALNNDITNSMKRFIISKVLREPLNKNEEERKFLKKNKKIKFLMCKQYVHKFILEN